MPSLADFMESLTQEKDKLVQMGTIKSSKYQALFARVLNPSKGNNKAKDSKQQDKKKQERPKSLDGVQILTTTMTRRSMRIPNATTLTKGGIQRVHV